VNRDFPRDDVCTLGVKSRVLLNKVGLADHVIVEEQQDFTGGLRCASISRCALTSVFLLDHSQRQRAIYLRQCVRTPIGRSVYDNDDLNRSIIGEPAKRDMLQEVQLRRSAG